MIHYMAGPGAPVHNAAAVFDVGTGRLITTGLNAANSTFADLGNTSSQRLAASSLFAAANSNVGQNQINTTTTSPLGRLAEAMIDGNSSNMSDNLKRFVPDYYGGLADYPIYVGKSVSNLLTQRVSGTITSPATAHDMPVYTGYLYNHFTTADQDKSSQNDFYLGSEYQLTEMWNIGALLLKDNGNMKATYGTAGVNGLNGTLYSELRLSPALSLLGSVGYASYDNTLSRNTLVGYAHGDTRSSAWNTNLAAVYVADLNDQWQMKPRLGITYNHGQVKGFTETGSADSLNLQGFHADETAMQLANTIQWKPQGKNSALKLGLDIGVEQVLSHNKGDMQATLVNNNQVAFPISFAENHKTSAIYGLSADYNFTKNMSVFATADGRSGNKQEETAKVGLNYTF